MPTKGSQGSDAVARVTDCSGAPPPEATPVSRCSAFFHYCDSEEPCVDCGILLNWVTDDEGNPVINVLMAHPLTVDEAKEKYASLSFFVLHGARDADKSKKAFYTSTMTDEYGKRFYVHCTAFYNGETFACISKYPWCNFFYRLGGLFDVRVRHLGEKFLEMMCSCPPPPSGANFPAVDGIDMYFKRPYDRICPFIDSSPLDLLTIFPDLDILFAILSNILLERTTIIVGSNYPIVSKVVMSLQTLISPFDWMHTILSPCTNDLIEYLHAPTPILCGLLTSQFDSLDEGTMESCLVVHLNENGVYKEHKFMNMKPCSLPKSSKLSKLRNCLNRLKQRTPNEGTVCDMCRVFLCYYAELYTNLTSKKFMSSRAASEASPDGFFYQTMCKTSRLSIISDEIKKCLDSGNTCWLDSEFIVALLRANPALSPMHYNQLINEENKGGGYFEKQKVYFKAQESLKDIKDMTNVCCGKQSKISKIIMYFSCIHRH